MALVSFMSFSAINNPIERLSTSGTKKNTSVINDLELKKGPKMAKSQNNKQLSTLSYLWSPESQLKL